MCTGNRTEGSNPSLSANPPLRGGCRFGRATAQRSPLRGSLSRANPSLLVAPTRRCSSLRYARSTERGADESDGLLGMPEHELGLEPKHAIAEPWKHAVPARVRCAAP